MERLFSSPHVLRLARRRKPVTLAVSILAGALAVWAITRASSAALLVAACLLALLLLAGLVYVTLDAAHRLHAQAAARADVERQLAALEESNAALKVARQELTQQKKLAENLLAVARATGQQPILENMLQN